MGVVYRHHVAGRIIGSTRTRIREILEAVEARGMVVLLRVLDAQQVALAEAVVDLDIPLVVRASRSARR